MMDFKDWVCGDKDFSMQIVLAARYNFYVTRAVKSLFYAAQNPQYAPHGLEKARADIDREIERRTGNGKSAG